MKILAIGNSFSEDATRYFVPDGTEEEKINVIKSAVDSLMV